MKEGDVSQEDLLAAEGDELFGDGWELHGGSERASRLGSMARIRDLDGGD